MENRPQIAKWPAVIRESVAHTSVRTRFVANDVGGAHRPWMTLGEALWVSRHTIFEATTNLRDLNCEFLAFGLSVLE